jgi:hypothetical protein
MIGTMTVDAVLGQGATVVSQFGSLVLLVVGLGMGIWAVKFVIRRIKNARR